MRWFCPFIRIESDEERRRRWIREDEDEWARAEAIPVPIADAAIIKDSPLAALLSPNLALSVSDFSLKPLESVLKLLKLLVIVSFLGGCLALLYISAFGSPNSAIGKNSVTKMMALPTRDAP